MNLKDKKSVWDCLTERILFHLNSNLNLIKSLSFLVRKG